MEVCDCIENRQALMNYLILKLYFLTELPDILVLVETWLYGNVLDSELHVDGFQFFRKDRVHRGGGIITYIKSTITCTH